MHKYQNETTRKIEEQCAHGKCGGELRKGSEMKGNRRTRNFPLLFPASPSAPLELDKLCGQPLKASPIHTPLFT